MSQRETRKGKPNHRQVSELEEYQHKEAIRHTPPSFLPPFILHPLSLFTLQHLSPSSLHFFSSSCFLQSPSFFILFCPIWEMKEILIYACNPMKDPTLGGPLNPGGLDIPLDQNLSLLTSFHILFVVQFVCFVSFFAVDGGDLTQFFPKLTLFRSTRLCAWFREVGILWPCPLDIFKFWEKSENGWPVSV